MVEQCWHFCFGLVFFLLYLSKTPKFVCTEQICVVFISNNILRQEVGKTWLQELIYPKHICCKKNTCWEGRVKCHCTWPRNAWALTLITLLPGAHLVPLPRRVAAVYKDMPGTGSSWCAIRPGSRTILLDEEQVLICPTCSRASYCSCLILTHALLDNTFYVMGLCEPWVQGCLDCSAPCQRTGRLLLRERLFTVIINHSSREHGVPRYRDPIADSKLHWADWPRSAFFF